MDFEKFHKSNEVSVDVGMFYYIQAYFKIIIILVIYY